MGQRNSIIEGLLTRANGEPGNFHRLCFLAAACLETAVELSPVTASHVRSALAKALPPSNMTEAKAVASVGPFGLAIA